MRKGIFFILGFYLILAIVILLIPQDKDEEITILTIQEDKSLILFPNEMIKFDLFTNKKDSFLFSNDEVSSSYLTSADNKYQVEIHLESSSDTTNEFYDESFYHVIIEVAFSEIWIDNITIPFENLYLEIHYENSEVLKIPFGNLMIHFKSELEDFSLSFTNIYAIKNSMIDDQLKGMIIHLYTIDPMIEILDISLELVSSEIDQANIKRVKDLRYQISEDIEGNTLKVYNTSSIILSEGEDLVLFLPINNPSNLLIRRFPIVITYSSNGNIETLIIDDFIYKSLPSGNLKEIENDIKITRYYY